MVSFVYLDRQWKEERDNLLPLIDKALATGVWIGGNEVDFLEEALKVEFDSRFAITLNSGTDALIFSLAAAGIGRGDEVITVSNSFIATTAAICHIGAIPVFIDVGDDQLMNPTHLKAALSKKTKAILPVHLTGRMCQMDLIIQFAKENKLVVIEDSAQAIGSKFKRNYAGTFGNAGAFSAHPLKNLNAAGDSGFILTDEKKIAEKTQLLRSHGLRDRNLANEFGFVSRMDSIQATVLLYRLKNLGPLVEKRRKLAQVYLQELNTLPVKLPPFDGGGRFDTFHTFVIESEDRDKLSEFLQKRNISTKIHYPTLIHKQKALEHREFRIIGELKNSESQNLRILSLPIHQNISEIELKQVCDSIKEYFRAL
jgi:dTDP-4-amino-4,6-dideoxygalactose transaminase